MNSANLRIWETNNLIKELRKCSTLFTLHNLRFWRGTETGFFSLVVVVYRLLQADSRDIKCSDWIDSTRSRQEKDSVFFMLFQKITLSCSGDLKSATVYLKTIDLMSKRNSAWSVQCFCHVDEKEQTASEVAGLKLCFLSCLLFSFLSVV